MTIVPTREQVPRLAAQVRRPGGRPGAPTAGGINLRDAVRIVRRRWLLILLTFLSVFGVMMIVTLLWWLYLPGYTARALLKVEPSQMNILDASNPFYPKDIIERGKRSQAALVKSEAVLTEVVNDPEVRKTTWYQKYKNEIYEEMEADIDVTAIPETEFIQISMTARHKEEIPGIVNSLANAFVRYAGEGPRRVREDKVKKLRKEYDTQRAKLDRARLDIASARAGSPSAGFEQRRSSLSMRLEMLTQDINKAEMDEAEATAALDVLTKASEGPAALDSQVQQMVDMDPSLRGMEMQVMDLETRVSSLVARLGEKHRAVESAKAALAGLTQQYNSRRDETAQQYAQALVQSRTTVKATATARMADLTARLNQARQEARDMEASNSRIDALTQEVKDTEDYIRRIEQRLMELELVGKPGAEDQAENMGPVSMASAATEPRERSSPLWELMIPAGIVLGLGLGFGVAFAVELSDTSIKTPSDVTRRVDLPLLGMVPHSEDLEEEVEDFRRVTLLAPHSPAAEAFRQIRTNLLFSGPAQERRSLLVTSPAPEDGRTTVVMNLATSMAQAGRRVLVVDANFRQPAIAAMFPQAAPAGLSSALVGQAAWRDVVSPSDVPNLSVITSGPLPPNPAELLGSDIMRQLVAEMTSEYDQVIFDGSPVLVVADASVLSTQVDGVILVVRAGSNSVGVVQRTSEQLHRVGAHMLGVVLQGVRTTAGGYMRKNYETFYEYQQKVLPQQ